MTGGRPDEGARRAAVRRLVLAGAVLLLALNLRPGASSVGPLVAEIRDDLGMSATVMGLLGALPALGFAVFGALAVRMAIRLGLGPAIAAGAVAAAVGLLGRVVVGGPAPFLALSLLAFGGMAVGNVLLPVFVKRHFPRRVPALTAMYSVGLAVGATVPPAVAAPLAAALPGGWRTSLALWGGTALVAALPWVVLSARERRRRLPSQRPVTERGRGVARSRKAVALAVFFGVQSTQAYVQFAWVAQIYRDGGLDPATAGLMGSLIAGFGIPAGLSMAWLVHRFADLRVLVVALGMLLTAGYTGLLLAPATLPWLWACLLGASGAAFPLAIALITIRTRHPRVTARVSAFTQSTGYLIAAGGPLAVGALVQATGGWTVPLVGLALSGLLLTGAGLVAAAPGLVDDELTTAT